MFFAGVIVGYLIGVIFFSWAADRMIEQKAEQKGWIEIRGHRYKIVQINDTQGEDI